MIALRGVIKHTLQPQGEPSNSTSDSGEWVWSGYWAFDSLPDPKFLENRKSKRPPHGVRPFLYKFHHVEDAKNVIVPSTAIDDEDSEDVVNKEHDDEKQEKEVISVQSNETEKSFVVGKVISKGDVSSSSSKMDGVAFHATEEIFIGTDLDTDRRNQDSEKVVLNESEVSSSKKLISHAKESFQENHITGSSFADIEGGTYTDGGTVFPGKCPKGGCWKGYFENASKRKDRMTSRVQETFHLFFNATPPQDALIAFVDASDDQSAPDDESSIDRTEKSIEESIDMHDESISENLAVIKEKKDVRLKEGHIHVRGAGTNKFGTFEIMGGYDVENCVLEIQRIYVITNDLPEVPKQQKINLKTKPKNPTPLSERKSYFTRKRPPTSFRYGDSPEPERSSSNKKRPKGTLETAALSPFEAMPLEDISGEQLTSSNSTESKPSISATLSIVLPDNIKEKSPSSRKPSPGKTTPKPLSKPKTPIIAQVSKVSSTNAVAKTNSSFGPIPNVGKPENSKWRSAHFLYYQRHFDESDGNTQSSNQPQRTSYVVYEGDMNEGGCVRDGKGVCLYNNGYIYEGDWKKNKEHGRGTLYSGDRKRKIYEGEWEKGKMHGKGTYSYFIYSNSDNLTKLQGSYTGDFKENVRHGVGIYTMADGCVYEGEWRDNVPSGRGVFRWPDGSKYDGQWKDGKRNGFGKLEVSDGFQYDGTWVDNGMEGKGFARYPNGQEYDGMWLNGKRDGRGTITFGNGAVYKGRFKDDCIEGQGTLKIENNVSIPITNRTAIYDNAIPVSNEETCRASTSITPEVSGEISLDEGIEEEWMIPIEFQSDIGRIHEKAGFTTGGE